jgi:hypothetical protein
MVTGEVCRQEWCPLAVGVKYIIPQTIVCEQKGADWLPFVHFRDVKSISRGVNTEVVWVSS